MHILIVDDSELFRDVLRTILSGPATGFFLNEAEDHASAEALLRQQQMDVAYLDICLPDGNGLNISAQLRKANPNAVIACCTSHDLPEYRDQATLHGADFFFPKESLTSAQILSVLSEGRKRTNAPLTAE